MIRKAGTTSQSKTGGRTLQAGAAESADVGRQTAKGAAGRKQRAVAALAAAPEPGFSAPAVRRGGLAEHVYAYVKQQILDGAFARDTWIPVDQIAAHLAVSRQPVMDALKRLTMEGFISIIPQVGCRIRVYTPVEIQDFYRLFAEGEALVAEFAAERATTDDIVALQMISAQIGRLRTKKLSAPDLSGQYRVLNRKLHFEIRRIARSESVTEVVESLGDRSDFFVATVKAPVFADRLRVAHDEHEEVIAAIADKRPAEARRIMKNHIAAIGDRLQVVLSQA